MHFLIMYSKKIFIYCVVPFIYLLLLYLFYYYTIHTFTFILHFLFNDYSFV